jgi:hypothetical protein
VGERLADRYHLLELVADGDVATLWRAHDDVLARPVAVKCVSTPNKSARAEAQVFLDAAVRASAVNHPGLARTYDAALESRPGRGNDVAYVIGEWVDGEPLDTHLERVGALAAVDAADVLRQAADALTAAHAAGLTHGRVHPGNVLVTAHGRVRITDTQVAAALHGGTSEAATPADDTRDLAAVLYALLTRRWPEGATPQPGGELPAAPHDGAQLCTARQLRAGVPRELDHVVTRGLEPTRMPALGALRTPAALADAVDHAVLALRAAEAEAEKTAEPHPPSRWRRSLPWVAGVAFVAAVAGVGWALGLAVGELPPRPGTEPIAGSTEGPSGGVLTYPAIPLARAVVKDFDPLGRDHQENPDQVQNATDDEPTTAWATQSYKTAEFSGLKSGVGLLIDLRKPTALHSATVAFTSPGTSVELRVSETAPAGPNTMQLVAAKHDDQVAVLRPPSGTRARYVLLWITKLPKENGSYRVGVSEVRLT